MMKRLARRRTNESGFTLIEVLTTLALVGILSTLGGIALRHFWLTRALKGGTAGVVTQLRATQEKVTSESYPLVYGVRFDPGSANWWVVKYDPVNAGPGDDTCTTTSRHTLGTSVVIENAAFLADSYITGFCKSQLGTSADEAIALFYPSGSATAGTVTLRQITLDIEKTIEVDGITGRVKEQ